MKSILEKVSYHPVYDASILDALRFAQANGFAGVQVAAELPHLSFENVTDAEAAQTANFCARHGTRVSLHAPDTMASLFEPSRHLREGIFRYFAAMFAFAERIGCRLITVHPGQMSSFGTDTAPRLRRPAEDSALYRKAFGENLSRLIELGAGRFVLCIENFNMDSAVMEVVQPHLDSGALSLCWDLAKTYDGKMQRMDELEDFFWRNLRHVRQVHLHDIRDSVSHCVIGSGKLDFMRYLPRLAEADVLDYCIEVRPREKALESRIALQRILGSGAKRG